MEKKSLCPKCKTPMSPLLFMGVQPDGWVCPKCSLYFSSKDDGQPNDKPLAVII